MTAPDRARVIRYFDAWCQWQIVRLQHESRRWRFTVGRARGVGMG